MQTEVKYCKCGCGEIIIFQEHHKWFPTVYIHGHNSKGNNNPAKGKGVGAKITKSKTGKKRPPCSDTARIKYKTATINSWKNEGIRKKRIDGLKRARSTTESREKTSKASKEGWKNPITVARRHSSMHIKPNKPESSIQKILNDNFPLQWKYTGDYSFMINGKNPDFVNCNGQKKIIELYGDYWHRNDNPQDRINLFAEFGYDTLIIWEKELLNQDCLLNKIKEFCNVPDTK